MHFGLAFMTRRPQTVNLACKHNVARGPFLESPGNFSGLEVHLRIKIYKTLSSFSVRISAQLVLSTWNFIVQLSKSTEFEFKVACSRRSDSGARAKNKASERAGKNEGRLRKRARERL